MDRDLDTSNATEPMRFCNDRSRIVHTIPAPSEVGMTEPLVLTNYNYNLISCLFTSHSPHTNSMSPPIDYSCYARKQRTGEAPHGCHRDGQKTP